MLVGEIVQAGDGIHRGHEGAERARGQFSEL